MGDSAAFRRALICGISGQDGAYLAQLLQAKGYEVWGTSRNAQTNDFAGLRALGVLRQINLLSMSPVDFPDVLRVISEIRPHEIYNMSGQSSVGLSFERPLDAMDSIALATLNLLEAIRVVDPSIRFCNAGSGECFGDTGAVPADENTPFHPRSPYAIAKAAATWQVALYRESYGLFACTGILFNHESPLRPEGFVTRKIVAAACRIARGSQEKLTLGNIDIRRDWGWAPEYVDPLWRMLNREDPGDFVIATGVMQSLQDFIIAVFSEAKLHWRSHVASNPELRRPSDPMECRANPEKASKLLAWTASCIGTDIAKRMYAAECARSQ